jgi:hypothetical protein
MTKDEMLVLSMTRTRMMYSVADPLPSLIVLGVCE